MVGRGKVFEIPWIKKQMLNLRLQGYSYHELAQVYGVHHTTIVYHCQVAGISIRPEKLKKIVTMIFEGKTMEEICFELNVVPVAVESCCIHQGIHGIRHFSRSRIHGALTNPKRRLWIKKHLDGVEEIRADFSFIREDERGVRWRKGEGEWICLGKGSTAANYTPSEQERKRLLDIKRAKMLIY